VQTKIKGTFTGRGSRGYFLGWLIAWRRFEILERASEVCQETGKSGAGPLREDELVTIRVPERGGGIRIFMTLGDE